MVKEDFVHQANFSREECQVGLVCRVKRDARWHLGRIVQVHETPTGLKLYRFKSDNGMVYSLNTREELRRP